MGDFSFYICSFIEKEGIFINGLILENWTMQEQVIPIIIINLENMRNLFSLLIIYLFTEQLGDGKEELLYIIKSEHCKRSNITGNIWR